VKEATRRVSEEEVFFSEEKKQKTFAHWSGSIRQGRSQKRQKFFAAFFQKSRPSSLPVVTTCLTSVLFFAVSAQAGPTLDRVHAAGKLACGVITEPADYDKDDTHGDTAAFGGDICRAVAAAVFGDASRASVEGFPDEADGLAAVQNGRLALLVGATPDPGLARRYGVVFGQPAFFDGQGFLVRRNTGITGLADLAGKTVCFIGTTDAEVNAHRALDARGIKFLPFPFEEVGEMEAALVSGHCSAETGDWSKIAQGRTGFHGQIGSFVLLPEQITLDPLSPVLAAGDAEWARVVDWTLYLLIKAEVLGITQANAGAVGRTGSDEAKTWLGTRRGLSWPLGLPEGWGLKVVEAVGNYGEVFERDLGGKSHYGLPRGPDRPWTDGGLLWAPPLR
jgi:general L-amino acid transport system substrate-binding protein